MAIEHRLSMSFAPTLQAPGRARRVVEEFAADLDPDACDKLKLLASELVTNAVTHADTPADHAVTLELIVGEDSVHMSVTDGGTGFERQGYPSVGDIGGWGLWLVDQLSSAWGTDGESSHRVWLDFALSPAGRSADRNPRAREY
jgi:anti-sigma regulatory factor (Ser/Thr protein kinase)